jgi:hypothetical protein
MFNSTSTHQPRAYESLVASNGSTATFDDELAPPSNLTLSNVGSVPFTRDSTPSQLDTTSPSIVQYRKRKQTTTDTWIHAQSPEEDRPMRDSHGNRYWYCRYFPSHQSNTTLARAQLKTRMIFMSIRSRNLLSRKLGKQACERLSYDLQTNGNNEWKSRRGEGLSSSPRRLHLLGAGKPS